MTRSRGDERRGTAAAGAVEETTDRSTHGRSNGYLMRDDTFPTGEEAAESGDETGGDRQSSVRSDGEASFDVLLADDDDDFRETLKLWLATDDRWEVREASNGEEAIDRLDGTVDVVVLDRQMPELSGPEVVERLPETEFGGRIVVLSACKPDGYLNEGTSRTTCSNPSAARSSSTTSDGVSAPFPPTEVSNERGGPPRPSRRSDKRRGVAPRPPPRRRQGDARGRYRGSAPRTPGSDSQRPYRRDTNPLP